MHPQELYIFLKESMIYEFRTSNSTEELLKLLQKGLLEKQMNNE